MLRRRRPLSPRMRALTLRYGLAYRWLPLMSGNLDLWIGRGDFGMIERASSCFADCAPYPPFRTA